jgi:hypothetical protein
VLDPSSGPCAEAREGVGHTVPKIDRGWPESISLPVSSAGRRWGCMEWSGGLQEKVVRREETLPAGRGRCQRRPGGSVGGRSVGLGFFFSFNLGLAYLAIVGKLLISSLNFLGHFESLSNALGWSKIFVPSF